ncbi:MAG TPA: zf-HC2 domain-containing protein [Actinomycetota bacterium]|nr:zf-HC2 domain-containing protein [Actinomycetota bacterium]
MITCAEAVRQLWEYLDRELSAEDRERVEEHLAFCRQCCGEREFAEELRRLLAAQRRDEIPRDVLGRLESLLAELGS